MSENNTNNTARQKFEIELDENMQFPSIADTAYMTSAELCKVTSELFRSVFADYEGCQFDVQGPEATISLLFNHGDYSNSDIPVACELASSSKSGAVVIDRIRRMDSLRQNGDRYYLTEDGMDAISELLTERLYNNGKPNWKNIVSEYQDKSNSYGGYYGYQQAPVYTKVSGISIKRLCGLLFGIKDEAGQKFDYDIKIASALNPGFGNPSNAIYIMHISKVSVEELNNLLAKVGLTNNASNIIR